MVGQRWFENRDNIVLVAEFLVRDRGVSAEDLLYFIEKPWKYEDEYFAALAAWSEAENSSNGVYPAPLKEA